MQRQQQEQEEEAAAAAAANTTSPRTKVNVYGDPVVVRPHISPRTKRLTKKHLKGEDFQGNYGQRLYQYGVKDFHNVSQIASTTPSQPRPRARAFLLSFRFSVSLSPCVFLV